MPIAVPRFITSARYHVDIGMHVFPTEKYGLVVRQLQSQGGLPAAAFLEPAPAQERDVLRVHERTYWDRCRTATLTPLQLMQLELPWSAALFDASCRAVQGSIDGGRLALEYGAGLHIGGGFHHAFPDHGEGFCVFNDVAVAVKALQGEGRISRALIADVDLHHGNGTAAIFAGDDTVATFSIHEQGIYPLVKPASTIDVGLRSGAGDDEFLGALRRSLLPLIEHHQPDLLVYVAGADPFEDDQLGSLRLSKAGLRERDRIVVDAARRHRLPILVVLAGGYARRVADTVDIHVATLQEAATLWR